ncbi:hypothetical protein QVD17_00146 [Tagetes erecta]|uniref:Uncharacterized protein n=1 Tax=Tagetes erecta TaxID=13708 RepID=A0AAD8L888_TARER|nr:hypothetical protein QVD17_00146 [Tagetes erecta]
MANIFFHLLKNQGRKGEISRHSQQFKLHVNYSEEKNVFYFSRGWRILIAALDLKPPLMMFFKMENPVKYKLSLFKMSGEEYVIHDMTHLNVKLESPDITVAHHENAKYMITPQKQVDQAGSSSAHYPNDCLASSSTKNSAGTYEITKDENEIYWFRQPLQQRLVIVSLSLYYFFLYLFTL